MSDKNIYQRVNAVMKEVAYVQKDTEVQGYKAVTHDMLTAVLRPSLVQHGIVVRVDQLKSKMIQQKVPKGSQGYSMHLYSGTYAIHFVNMDNPEDFITVTANAHANDSGDKAPGKAMSYAVKFAMLKTFTLETGESDEARFSDPYTTEQHDVYHDLLETGKAYEFYMFTAALPPETLAGLYNSFPDGKKMQGKKAVSKLESEGRVAFNAVVDNVQGMLAKQDIAVLEITDELSVMENQMLAKHLTDFEIAQLKRLKEAAA